MSGTRKTFLNFKYPIGAAIAGWILIFLGVCIIIILQNYVFGFMLLLIGVYLGFSHTGIAINSTNGMFKYYQSHFGLSEGAWRFLKHYPYISVLTIDKKQNVHGPSQVEILHKFKVYKVYLLNDTHREKFLLGEYENKQIANSKAKIFANDLGATIVTYSPVISVESLAKRR